MAYNISNVFSLIRVLLNRAAAVALILTSFLVFYSVPWLSSRSYIYILLLGTFLSISTLYLYRRTALKGGFRLPTVPNINLTLFFIILTGVALRIAWISIVPPIQLSDFLSYLSAAQRILESQSYYYNIDGHTLYAWRPPGYPFLLALCFLLFGEHPLIPAFANLIFYILTSWVVYKISFTITRNEICGVFGVLILALCPNYIAVTGLASSEPISLLLFTGIYYFFISANESSSKGKALVFAIAAGVSTGYCTLIKPSVLMLPVLFVLYILMLKEKRKQNILILCVSMFCMMIVILPWSIRNYYKTNHMIIVSSNGGDVFYRANNPLAGGGYNKYGEKDLSIYLPDEGLWSKKGFEWGKEWIINNPSKYPRLFVRKIMLFLGDDYNSFYWTMERGHGNTGIIYKFLKILSNIWWIGLWVLVICGALKNRRFLSQTSSGGLLAWMTLFFVVVHAVFESHSRYHMPMIGLLAVVATFYMYSSTSRDVKTLS